VFHLIFFCFRFRFLRRSEDKAVAGCVSLSARAHPAGRAHPVAETVCATSLRSEGSRTVCFCSIKPDAVWIPKVRAIEFHSCMSPTAANVKRNGGVSAGPHSAIGRRSVVFALGCGPGACTEMEWNRSLRSESCIGLRKLSAVEDREGTDAQMHSIGRSAASIVAGAISAAVYLRSFAHESRCAGCPSLVDYLRI